MFLLALKQTYFDEFLRVWFVWFVKESDLHTKRTGHTEFVDKTLEAEKPISLEVPKAAGADADGAVDASTR